MVAGHTRYPTEPISEGAPYAAYISRFASSLHCRIGVEIAGQDHANSIKVRNLTVRRERFHSFGEGITEQSANRTCRRSHFAGLEIAGNQETMQTRGQAVQTSKHEWQFVNGRRTTSRDSLVCHTACG